MAIEFNLRMNNIGRFRPTLFAAPTPVAKKQLKPNEVGGSFSAMTVDERGNRQVLDGKGAAQRAQKKPFNAIISHGGKQYEAEIRWNKDAQIAHAVARDGNGNYLVEVDFARGGHVLGVHANGKTEGFVERLRDELLGSLKGMFGKAPFPP